MHRGDFFISYQFLKEPAFLPPLVGVGGQRGDKTSHSQISITHYSQSIRTLLFPTPQNTTGKESKFSMRNGRWSEKLQSTGRWHAPLASATISASASATSLSSIKINQHQSESKSTNQHQSASSSKNKVNNNVVVIQKENQCI